MIPSHPPPHLAALVAEQTAAFNNPKATEDDRVFVFRKIQEEQTRLRKEEH